MNCLFCKIIKREIPNYLIDENEKFIVILDAFPVSDGHCLIISKDHFKNISEIEPESWKESFFLIKKTINKIEKELLPKGFNVITNMGEEAYQTIFHFHIHIIPKYEKESGFIWNSKSKLKYNLKEVFEKISKKW